MAEIHNFTSRNSPTLETGGGPPQDGDMEKRVSKLEDQHTQILVALARIETRLDSTDQRFGSLDRKIDRLPDKFWIGRLMILTIAGTFALLLTANKILELMGTAA